jgi:DeoR/GlpR family transcriptional regulator of sugar metabolism
VIKRGCGAPRFDHSKITVGMNYRDNLTTFERRQRILTFLREQPGIRVPDLARLAGVSEGTIRNDLRALDGSGQLMRVRGGGVPLDEQPNHSLTFATRAMAHRAAKLNISRHSANWVQDNDSVLLDSSTTVYYLACQLRDRRDLTVITNGIEAARELAKNPTNTVILLGGVLRVDGMSVNVPLGESFLDTYHIKTAFVSCSGYTPESGLTEVDIYEAQIKRKMIANSGVVVALIDSSKFGRTDLTPFASTGQLTHIYTDDNLDPEWIEQLQRCQVPFTLCGKDRD